MLEVLRIGCLWHDMHERYDKLIPVFLWFGRCAERGIWDALRKRAPNYDEQHRNDSTATAAFYPQRTGGRTVENALGRTRGRLQA